MKKQETKEQNEKTVKSKKYISTDEDFARSDTRKKIELYNEEQELKRMYGMDYY